MPDQPADPAPPETVAHAVPEHSVDVAGDEAPLLEELLVEDVSIDGMCGVY